MSATIVRDRRQVTIPEDVSDAAGLRPGDQVDWRFVDGEIRGQKLVRQTPRRVVAKLVKRGGKLTFELPKGVQLDPEAIGQAVAEERESR